MMLHSASRLGVLSYVYQQRHVIAEAIGLIAEVPIAMCDSSYHLSNELQVVAHDSDTESVPPSILAHEIQLFFTDVLSLASPDRLLLPSQSTALIETAYSSPPLPIQHPPC